MRRLIAIALAVVPCLPGSLLLAAEPTHDQANTALTSVWKGKSYVFASTIDGVFRAPLDTKRWERLETPPEMPPDGTFASQPEPSTLVIYVAMRSRLRPQNRPGSRYGLYLSRDNGTSWELVSERDDYGSTLLHPNGTLFAVTGADGFNKGHKILRSPDLGKTWVDITGNANGALQYVSIDPDHPNLIRLHSYSIRLYLQVAEDESYQWKTKSYDFAHRDEFFSRDSSARDYYVYSATLANYFKYDFGNQTDVQAFEVVPLKSRFTFRRRSRVVIPIRVVFHCDPDTIPSFGPKSTARERAEAFSKMPPVKFADQPEGTDFWGLRVESSGTQTASSPPVRRSVTTTVTVTAEGRSESSTSQPIPIEYRTFDLTPSSPYEREIDLSQRFKFSRPGEYRVQLVYTSGDYTDRDKDEWDGTFTSPVFTVVIGE
jgi:hypothetical protein